MTGVFISRGKLELRDTWQGRGGGQGEGRVSTEAQMGVMWAQATEDQGLPGTTRSQEREAQNRLALGASRRNQPCPHLDFGLLTSRAVGE